MSAWADHDNTGSHSKQHEKTKMGDWMDRAFPAIWEVQISEIFPPKNFLVPRTQETQDTYASGAISSKHLTLWKL